MSEATSASGCRGENRPLPRVTIVAAILILVLALGAVFFPRAGSYDMQGVFLVFDAPGSNDARVELFSTMADVLEELSGHTMALVVVDTREEFLLQAKQGVDFVLCPDGLALELDQADFGLLVAGRRKLPANLRPRGVMVFRREGGFEPEPWQSHPERTVFGDSLSLVAIGGTGPMSEHRFCAFGPDPYDHGPVLHALRLGAFDFALVRQWDANKFFAHGLLDSVVWGVEERTVPVPDIVLLASRRIPLVERLKWADSLALIGRSGQMKTENPGRMLRNLEEIGLVGFNLLLEPDFELVRRNFQGNWLPEAD